MKPGLAFSVLAFSALATGCGSIMDGLRKDFDDDVPASQPTTGGAWTERGMLDENSTDSGSGRYAAVGHSEQALSATSNAGHPDGWVTADNIDSNRKDGYRRAGAEEDGGPSYASNPNYAPGTRRQYKNGSRATRNDFVDESANEGSLWASDGQTNYYFTKNKVRSVGDLLNVTMEADLVRDTAAEIARTLNPSEKDAEIALAQERIRSGAEGAPGKDSVTTSASSPTRAPASADAVPGETPKPKSEDAKDGGKKGEIRQASASDIDISKEIGIKSGDILMAEIVERYPNGNYKIRGMKKVPFHGGFRMVSLLGIAKGSDIGEDDTIPSGKLYEYRLESYR